MWLIDVLDAALPNLTGGERDAIAKQILAALPADQIALEVGLAVGVELKRRGIPDAAGDIAQVIGNHSAISVVEALKGV